ncbi:hypothetical protein LCGC14_1174740 [marine sediment metagenome]|uniref:Uncharacterized protein n=1 Tax=marine sediment metagenome TaxID=412755 RepID=A0A0F9PUD7_9ZZZZ
MKTYKEIKPFKQRKQPKLRHPEGKIIYRTILDEEEIEHGDPKGKFYRYLVQEILYESDDILDIEFRFCYYYINFSNEKPHWIFGQYALTILKSGFKDLLNKMKEKGWN